MKGKLIFIPIANMHHFKRNPDVNDDIKDQAIVDPETWWYINIVRQNQSAVTIKQENIIENALEIQEWIEETFDYSVIATAALDEQKITKKVPKIIKKKGLFSSKNEKVFETVEETTKVLCWQFFFRNTEDATLFATAWRGEEG